MSLNVSCFVSPTLAVSSRQRMKYSRVRSGDNVLIALPMRFVKSILSDIEARGQDDARSSIFRRAHAGLARTIDDANVVAINRFIDCLAS